MFADVVVEDFSEIDKAGDGNALQSAGPAATLIQNDIETVPHGLKTRLASEIDVAGPNPAHTQTDLGLVDEYRLYLRPSPPTPSARTGSG